MTLYDISLPISNDLPVFPDDPPVLLTLARSITEGHQCNISKVQMGVHTGTHVDAPYHFLNNGTMIDAIPIETFVGPCFVVELNSEHLILKEDFQKYSFPRHSRVLIKTKNSRFWANNCNSFNSDYVALGITAAQYLIEMRAILVGIDYLSIEAFNSDGGPIHQLLLKNDIAILEGLNLSAVKEGEYELICLPLKLQMCEAAPARVLLLDKLR
jgi:arylformamidase